MKPDEFRPVFYPEERISVEAKKHFIELSGVLKVIEEENPDLVEIGCRGGYILDTLLGLPPNDIDLFYRVKPGLKRCQCSTLRSYLEQKKFELFEGRKVDLGHLEPGEIELPLAEKTAGIFSHHIDFPSRLFLDSSGKITTNAKTIDCIEKQIHEIHFAGWLQHAYFPLNDNPFRKDLYYFVFLQSMRGLRMIFTKKYNGCGNEFRNLLQMLPKSLEYCYEREEFRGEVTRFLKENIHGMGIENIEWAVKRSRVENEGEIMQALRRYY